MSTNPAPAPATADDDTAPRAADALAQVTARITGRTKLDPLLYRVVEVVRDDNGRLVHEGKIWHRDLSRARRFGRAVAANSSAQRVQIADATGAILETIPFPPPGTPAAGWGAWQNRPLPAMPPRPAPARKPVPAKPAPAPAPAPVAAPAAPPAASPSALPPPALPFTPDEPENEVERTRTLPPV